jgi:hypothetical protein
MPGSMKTDVFGGMTRVVWWLVRNTAEDLLLTTANSFHNTLVAHTFKFLFRF